ncbi:MAG TPA: PEP-CTERM sorting domain-containing protein [Casimicrobiaceae bacterium]|nr:PEP-CTERM sorting domain-containing protein [Casimicrobiaceae bacterium]
MNKQLGIFVSILAGSLVSGLASATPISYDLFYTTFSGGANVNEVHVDYTGNGTAGNGVFSLTLNHNIASTGGADGIVFNPNNSRLLVGGQGNAVHEVNPTTGAFTTATPGVNAFHLAVDPSLMIVWVSSIPGALASMPISPNLSGPGTILTLSGDDTAITSLAFTPSNGVFYTSGGSGGFGSFGSINLTTGVTTRILTNVPAAHGMQFDPFSGNLILDGSNQVSQINPAAPGVIISTATFAGMTFDQGAADGLGHLFIASNTGTLLFLDYSTTSLVGSPLNFSALPFLASSLDDVAPLIGAGGTGCGQAGQPACRTPEPSPLLLMGIGAAGLLWLRRRRTM